MNLIFQAVWNILGKSKLHCPKCGAPLPKHSRSQTVECPQCRAQVRGVASQRRDSSARKD
jgi:uncharacterized Zn finger protein (UPF0148 family)